MSEFIYQLALGIFGGLKMTRVQIYRYTLVSQNRLCDDYALFVLRNVKFTRIFMLLKNIVYRSLGALRAPPGLLDNVLHALRALRSCDPRTLAIG